MIETVATAESSLKISNGRRFRPRSLFMGKTPEQLVEALGVSNKTVSRWETRIYIPPVEMLEQLSVLYGVSINEIVSGQRLNDQQYREKAEENIKEALSESAFTLKERIAFFEKKWKKEHAFELTAELAVLLVFFCLGFYFDNSLQIVAVIAGLVWSIRQYNRMCAFVETYAYDGGDNL